MFGQFHFFDRLAGKEIEGSGLCGWTSESRSACSACADIATLGWVRNLTFYEARYLVEFGSLHNVPAWLERRLARPAVQRGLDTPKRK